MRRALRVLMPAAALVLAATAPARLGAAREPSDLPAAPAEATFSRCFGKRAALRPVKGFTAYGGSWAAQGGELQVDGGPGPKLICDAPPFSSGEAGVELLLPDRSSGNAGFIVKVSGCGVGADRFNGYELTLDTAGHLVVGRHRQNFERIRNVPCKAPVNRWIALVVRMTEKTLEVLVDGRSIVRYEDRQHPLVSGRVGLRPWQRRARFRNLWISTGGRRRAIPFESPRGPGSRASPAEILARAKVPPIAFITRHPLSSPNTISCDIWQSRPRRPGCSIRTFDPSKPERGAKTVFKDPGGCVYDTNISFDARTLNGTRSASWASTRSGAPPATEASRIPTTRGESGTGGWRGSTSPARSGARR